jgi:hypothetical protein
MSTIISEKQWEDLAKAMAGETTPNLAVRQLLIEDPLTGMIVEYFQPTLDHPQTEQSLKRLRERLQNDDHL